MQDTTGLTPTLATHPMQYRSTARGLAALVLTARHQPAPPPGNNGQEPQTSTSQSSATR